MLPPFPPVLVVLLSVLVSVLVPVPSFLLFTVVSVTFSLPPVTEEGVLSAALELVNEVIVFFVVVIWDLFPRRDGGTADPVLVTVVDFSVNSGRFEPWENTCL